MNNDFFTIVINRDIMWKYFTYYKLKHPKARTFPFAKKISEKLYNKDGSPSLTKSGNHRTKSRSRKLIEIDKNSLRYNVLSLNDLLPINSMSYKTKKKQWGDFGLFLAKINNIENRLYNAVVVEYVIYSETKAKKDIDNMVGASKLLNDGLFVESGCLKDDNFTILNPFIGSAYVDNENPRLEIRVSIINKEIESHYDKMVIHINNFK